MSRRDSRFRQGLVVAAIELRRRLRGRQVLGLLFVTGIPLALVGARLAATLLVPHHVRPFSATTAYAVFYRVMVLRFTVFFGCMLIFTQLIRGEIVDRSLHYWFLAPLRRSTLAAGKFAAGLVVALVAFLTVTALSWLAIVVISGRDAQGSRLASAGGLLELASYLAATSLACVGYGAVFLAVGVVFRQPIVPALVLLGWESVLFLMPTALKKISVVHHIESLLPVPPPVGPLAIVGDPGSPWIAVPGLALIAAAAVAFAARRLERSEILYGGE